MYFMKDSIVISTVLGFKELCAGRAGRPAAQEDSLFSPISAAADSSESNTILVSESSNLTKSR